MDGLSAWFYSSAFEPLLLTAVLALGVSSSLEDLRLGKISNKLVFSAAAFSIILHAPLAFAGGQNARYFQDFAQNFFSAAIFAFAFWELKAWSAGDAKLFAAFAALVPLSFYEHGRLPIFPSFALFANTLVPAALFLLVLLWRKTDFAEKKEVFKKAFKPVEAIQAACFAFAFSWALAASSAAGAIQRRVR